MNKIPFLINYNHVLKDSIINELSGQYKLVYANSQEDAIIKIKENLGSPMIGYKWIITSETIL